MISKKKVGSLLLLTVLIVSLVFANLNVTSIVAETGAGAGTGNPGTTMTFDSSVTMEFGSDKYAWFTSGVYLGFTSGVYLCFYNETFDNVTEIAVGAGYYAEWNETEEMYEPENCSWWYIYAPEELYEYGPEALPLKIHVCNVTFEYAEAGWNYSYFNIDEIWCGLENLTDVGVTLETPAEWIEAEQCIDTIAPGMEYYAYWNEEEDYYEPWNCSWWYLYWPEEIYGFYLAIHVNYTEYGWYEEGWNYSYFQIDEVWDHWYQVETSYTVEPPLIPWDCVEGEQCVDTIGYDETYELYYCAFVDYVDYMPPMSDTWWFVDYPAYGVVFHVDDTGYVYIEEPGVEEYWYVHFDMVLNATGQLENVTFVPPRLIPAESFGAYELVKTIAPYAEYETAYYIEFYNTTDGNITEIAVSEWYTAWIYEPWGYFPPVNCSWLYIYDLEVHIDNVTDIYVVEEEEEYCDFRIDYIYNLTSEAEPANVTVPSVEYIEGTMYITTTPILEYYISSPACYLPEDAWFNITYPEEINNTQIHVDYSYEWPSRGIMYSYFHIDEMRYTNGTTITTSINLTVPIDYVEATAPTTTVSTIGSWYNVIEDSTPDVPSCWNITAPAELKGVTFFVDMACEGVFHIDEVLDATGQPGPITLETPVENVTAELWIPAIYVEPAPSWYITGENYTVLIKTDYVFHVWSYEFTLEWNPDVLEGIEVTNGDLVNITNDVNATFMEGTFDNISGKLSRTGAYFSYAEPDPAPQTHGPGTLATVTFKVVGYGACDIELGTDPVHPTRLVGVTEEGFGEKYNAIDDITGQIQHGFFDNTVYDIVVTSVTVSPDTVEIGQPVSINVTVANEGDFSETFNVTVYANVTAIQTKTVTNLASGNQTTLTFSWDTTGVTLGSYNISAYAAPVPGETYTFDNTFIDGTVTMVKPPLANFAYSPEHPAPNQAVTFDASLSTPDGGTITSYAWNFGDGNTTTTADSIITHVYTAEGTYNVTLTITDSEGLTDALTDTVTVQAPAPTILLYAAVAAVAIIVIAAIAVYILKFRKPT